MFFGVILESGKLYQQEPDMPLHLSMATIQPATTQAAAASIVSVYSHTEENEKFLICSLHPQNTYQVPLDLTFIEGQTVTLSTDGPGKVHVTGYYMPETEMDFDDEDDSDMDGEAESEDVDDEDVAETQKRPAAPKDVSGPAAKKVKIEQKSEVKKDVKKEAGKVNGQAAKPAADKDSDDEYDDADEDESGDEEDLNALLADIKKARGKQESGAGDQMNVSTDADGDDDDDDEEEDDDDEDAEMDEEDSDEDGVAEQQKQLKQSLTKDAKPQNGAPVGKGAAKPQGKWQQDGKAAGRGNQQQGGQRGGGQHRGGGGRGGGGFGRGGGGGRGGFHKGGRGSPGNKSPGFRDGQSRGRGGGTPFNKNKNFSHGSGQKTGGFGKRS